MAAQDNTQFLLLYFPPLHLVLTNMQYIGDLFCILLIYSIHCLSPFTAK